jgi:hypothetical protein
VSQIQVRDEAGAPVVRVNIRIAEGRGTSDEAIFDILTDPSGNQGWPIPFWPARDYTLHVNKRDVLPEYGEAEVYVSAGDRDVPVTLPRASAKPIGRLRAQGIDFVGEDGQPWLFAGYTIHTAVNMVRNGEDLDARLEEAKGYGANTIVSIGTHLSPWKREHGFLLDPFAPGYQDALAIYFDRCAAHQVYAAHAALADMQGRPQSDVDRIWAMTCEVAKGRQNVLPRVGNEDLDNGFDCMSVSLPDLGGCLASRGSRGMNRPPARAFWQWAEWEGRRTPRHKAMDDAGAGILELQAGYTNATTGEVVGPFPCPLVGIEHAAFHDEPFDQWGDSRWTDAGDALKLGLEVSTNCVGGAFLASDGMIGRPLQERAATCARAYFRGLWAGFVR